MTKTDHTLFFIHIPKTAGSSFRKAAEAFFGPQATFYDYGSKANETHRKILELDYEKQDRYATGQYILKHARFLSGHLPYSKYASFFHCKNIITFIRKPEQQIRSHFEHYKRHHGYTRDFKTFIQEKRFCNIQSRLLNGLSVEAFGFIGLTEEYETSIKLINQHYKIDLKSLTLNQNTSKIETMYSFDDEELQLIKEHNQNDMELYQQAAERFEQQAYCLNNDQDFVRFGLLHLPPKQAEHKINGWATCYENDTVQTLDIYINEELTDTITAKEYRGIAKERNMNRNGYIGFMYEFPKTVKTGDLIQIKVHESQQNLFSTQVLLTLR